MIYDTDSPSVGGTADWPGYHAAMYTVAAYVGGDIDQDCERALRKAERHADLMRLLGARMKKLSVQWWPVTELAAPGPQVQSVERLGIWSGLREPTRGRHWNRKRR
jgi:hypothetical protein